MPHFLRFGIPSLDKLVGSHGKDDYGILLTSNDENKKDMDDATGICLMGPDGTGKSVFALHLASQYLADCLGERAAGDQIELPKIYYISTDLNEDKAKRIWSNFALNRPFDRKVPFEEIKHPCLEKLSKSRKRRILERLKDTKIELDKYTPQNVDAYVQPNPNGKDKQRGICFIDLAATTAGDDWGFAYRLLALMQQPEDGHPRHLVIIDAVEGFETYVGELDAFGEASSRRARIAQLARLAVKKTHVLLIVEEMRTMQRLPEEFVTDIVIRLRNVEVNKYLRRTVEIEKARGQSLVRGQHSFTIRKGKGSTTGSQENADDPEILSPDNEAKKGEGSTAGTQVETKPQSESSRTSKTNYPFQDYVQVFPSINYLNRAIMEMTHAPRKIQPRNEYAAFGIRYLDNMLGGEGFEAEPEKDKDEPAHYHDTRGLPCGTVTALIGDSLTQKTRLGRSFLSRCFFPIKQSDYFASAVEALKKKGITDTLKRIRKLKERRENPRDQKPSEQEEIHRELKGFKDKVTNIVAETPKAQELLERCGVAVLFTTLDTHHEALAEEFLDRGLSANLKDNSDEKLIAEILIESRTICRRMEIHDVPAATLAHIFEQNIRKAQKFLDEKSLSNSSDRFKSSKRIRVVFDDFNAFRNTYHEVREEPLFLPYLLFFLGREGVTALIVDTQSISRPDLTLTERYESELRELVQHRLYTWRVPFYGENRVAITAIPPFSPGTSGAIRELRWESIEEADSSRGDGRSLEVNPHFELYTGLEEGKLQPVPIEIRFRAESKAFKRYLEAEEVTLAELFVPYKHEGQTEKAKVLFYYEAEDYNVMRDFCSLQGGRRLDHTLIFQVDEFWTLQRPKPGRTGAFRPQWNYLTTPTWEYRPERNAPERNAVADPYAIFQPTKEEEAKLAKEEETKPPAKLKRLDFYDRTNIPYVLDYKEAMGNATLLKSLKKNLNRVPFSWDFGFLLCKGAAWKDAEDQEIFREKAVEEGKLLRELWSKKPKEKMVKVGELWEALAKATLKSGKKKHIGWFEFLAACKRVSELQSYKTPSLARTFDFSVSSPETFPSLVLEIWASEILKDNRNDKNENDKNELIEQLSVRGAVSQPRIETSLLGWLVKDRLKKDKDDNEKQKTLSDCLKARYGSKKSKKHGFALELYKTWLLLIETIDFSELITTSNEFSLELKPKQVSASVIAARHWYKTACQFVESISEQELEANWVPVRLPGHFSVRGDWFLSVAGGSRSSQLADRALDLLGSKRANINRLHEGVGLPVRKLFDSSEKDCHLRTRLVSFDEKQLTNLPYKIFLKIGENESEDFRWLWRSNLYGYHNDIRIWHRWLSQMIVWWHSLRLRYESSWTSCFEIYARLENLERCEEKDKPKECKKLLRRLETLDSWKEFHEMVEDLIDSLKQVSIESD